MLLGSEETQALAFSVVQQVWFSSLMNFCMASEDEKCCKYSAFAADSVAALLQQPSSSLLPPLSYKLWACGCSLPPPVLVGSVGAVFA